MEHWMHLLTIANLSSDPAHTLSAPAAVHNTEVAQLRREVDRLRQSVRSRSPRGGRGQGPQLALSSQPFSETEQRKDEFHQQQNCQRTRQKPRKEKKKGQQAANSGAARSSTGKTCDEILKDPAALHVSKPPGRKSWHFQRGHEHARLQKAPRMRRVRHSWSWVRRLSVPSVSCLSCASRSSSH